MGDIIPDHLSTFGCQVYWYTKTTRERIYQGEVKKMFYMNIFGEEREVRFFTKHIMPIDKMMFRLRL